MITASGKTADGLTITLEIALGQYLQIRNLFMTTTDNRPFDPTHIDRPDPALLRYYIWIALLTGPLSPLVLAPLWFRYATLRYQFDDSGISMKWGIIFRREIYLTYRRIQDIHLTRNILQRWMGLAKISLQTASGSSQAEMAIEGVLQAELLRDFLYSQMRGARDSAHTALERPSKMPLSETLERGQTVRSGSGQFDSPDERALQALLDIRDNLQRLLGENRRQAGSPPGDQSAAKPGDNS
jgi:putative membrane protein